MEPKRTTLEIDGEQYEVVNFSELEIDAGEPLQFEFSHGFVTCEFSQTPRQMFELALLSEGGFTPEPL
jgi:hypothetical protein